MLTETRYHVDKKRVFLGCNTLGTFIIIITKGDMMEISSLAVITEISGRIYIMHGMYDFWGPVISWIGGNAPYQEREKWIKNAWVGKNRQGIDN